MCLAQGPQRSDAREARTRGSLVSSQALYHWATALPRGICYISKSLNVNIGIKHFFLCIGIYWTQKVMLKPEPERLGFYQPPRGLADVNASENHVWSLWLHSHFVTWNENASKSSFCITVMARRFRRFWKCLFQSKDLCQHNVAKLRGFLACYCWWRQFSSSLECVYVKYKSRESTAG